MALNSIHLHCTETSKDILLDTLTGLGFKGFILPKFSYLHVDFNTNSVIGVKEIKGKKYVHLTRANIIQMKLLSKEVLPYYIEGLIHD